jgi:transcriptional regulator with XRE-family HTH domain
MHSDGREEPLKAVSVMIQSFGQHLRQSRLAKGFSLRQFAAEVGVSPTYLSHVEMGKSDPPTAERVRRIAELLKEDPDELIASAGHIPEDLVSIILKNPKEISQLLRETRRLGSRELQTIVTQLRRRKTGRRPQ